MALDDDEDKICDGKKFKEIKHDLLLTLSFQL